MDAYIFLFELHGDYSKKKKKKSKRQTRWKFTVGIFSSPAKINIFQISYGY